MRLSPTLGLLFVALVVVGCGSTKTPLTAKGALSTSPRLDGPVLPPELAFLKDLDSEPDTERRMTFQTHTAGPPERHFEQEFVCPHYEFVAIPQQVAHRLKAELTEDLGWTLSFPSVGSYAATAFQTKDGVKRIELEYVPDHGDDGVIYLWDNGAPVRTEDLPLTKAHSQGESPPRTLPMPPRPDLSTEDVLNIKERMVVYIASKKLPRTLQVRFNKSKSQLTVELLTINKGVLTNPKTSDTYRSFLTMEEHKYDGSSAYSDDARIDTVPPSISKSLFTWLLSRDDDIATANVEIINDVQLTKTSRGWSAFVAKVPAVPGSHVWVNFDLTGKIQNIVPGE